MRSETSDSADSPSLLTPEAFEQALLSLGDSRVAVATDAAVWPALAAELASLRPGKRFAHLQPTGTPALAGSGTMSASLLLVSPFDLEALRRQLESFPTGTRVAVLSRDAPPDLSTLLELGWRFRAPRKLADNLDLRCGARGKHRIRAYREGDEDAVLDLFGQAFHTQRSAAHWIWKYRDQPFGKHRISLAFDEEDQLVGQYCAYPVPYDPSPEVTGAAGRSASAHTRLPTHDTTARQTTTHKNRAHQSMVHQVGDTMTSPAVRAVGRGHSSILASVAEHFYSSFCRGEVTFNYGFNTGSIQRFSTRFVGAYRIEDAHFRRLPRSRLASLGAPSARIPKALQFPRVAEIEEPGPEIDALYARARPHYGSLVTRDRDYISWRYFQRPDLEYRTFGLRSWGRLRGWSVFARRERTLVWGDALFERRFARHAGPLLATVIRELELEAPIDEVIAWFPPRPRWWHEELETLGFETLPEPQGLGMVVVPFTDPEIIEPLRQDAYYAYGDSDLF